ncbi:MAG: hypothetical protein ACTSWC_08735 [Promethearchaeota archaeon]
MGYLKSFPEKSNFSEEIKSCRKIIEKAPYNFYDHLIKPMQQSLIDNYHSLRKSYIKKIMQNEFRFHLKNSLPKYFQENSSR